METEFVDRKPRTGYELTEEGKELFEGHLQVLDAGDELEG